MISYFIWRFLAVFFALSLGILYVGMRRRFEIRERAIYRHGYQDGRSRGRDEGWLERNQEELEREQKRRAANGQFRSIRGEVSP